MKVFKNIVSGVVWTLLGLYILTITLIHIPSIQRGMGEQTARLLSDLLATEVRIGRVDLGFLNRIIIDDVQIYDRKHKKALHAARIAVKIDLTSLLDNKIAISSAQVFGTHIKLYQTSKDTDLNIQFIIDALSSKDDKKKKSPLDLRINTFIMQHSSITYDRYDIAPTPNKFNPSHISARDISAHISVKALKKDSLDIIVKKFSLREQSGLNLTRLTFHLNANNSEASLQKFCLKMPGTELNLNDVTATYRTDNDRLQAGTLKFSGSTVQSSVTLSDFAFILPTLRHFDDKWGIVAVFRGTDTDVSISRFGISSKSGELKVDANGRITNLNAAPRWHVTVRDISIAPELSARIGKSIKEDIADIQGRLGHIRLNGEAGFDGRQTQAAIRLSTSLAGEVMADLSMTHDKKLSGTIRTSGADIGQVMANEKFGTVDADIAIKGQLPRKGHPLSLTADGKVNELNYNSYTYKNIALRATLDGGRVAGNINIDDPNIALSIDGDFKKTGKTTDIQLSAALRRFSPAATNISSTWGEATFDADLSADLKAGDVNDAAGYISLKNFTMTAPGKSYSLDRLDLTSGYRDDGTHFLSMQSDFGVVKVLGVFDYRTLTQTLRNIVKDKLPTMPGLESAGRPTDNSFRITAKVVTTDWLNALFDIPIELGEPIMLAGIVDDRKKQLAVDCDIPDFKYDGKEYKYGEIDITSVSDTLRSCIGITKIMDNGHGLELRVTGDAADNHLTTSLSWDNNSPRRMVGQLNTKTRFFRNDNNKTTAEISIMPSEVNINNAAWNVKPASITYTKNNIAVNDFAVINGNQHIFINGTASGNPADSLSVDLRDVDIEYILDLVNFHSVDFSGRATGQACLSAPFGDMAAGGRLTVKDFKFENGRMGTLTADVNWNGDKKQIDIDAVANDGPDAATFINGYVSPVRSDISLNIRADSTYIDFMRSFTGSFLRDVNGRAKGEVTLAGPLKAINLTGSLVVDGEATVKSTNCKYFLRKAVVNLIPDDILLDGITIHDIYDRRGTLGGAIHHHNLGRLSYDLSVTAENLLAYDFRDFGDDTFYGTVFGTGRVDIKGRSGELNIDINLTPQKNSSFVYNVTNPDAISDQEFIRWHDATPSDTSDVRRAVAKRTEPIHVDIPTDTHINFLINCTPETTVKVLMDARTNDYITLNGRGTLRATYYNKGSFNMFGTYVVDHGTYGITIQDIIKKNFVFNNGGTIVFGGDPYDAALNLQAIYTVNGVSLSDLNIGNSFSSNTIRVNCLMNIGGQPKAPLVSFDLDMPTVNSDEKQMIRSIINSEDEMNQQVIYLLGIGRFYPQDNNNATAQNEKQQSQTSLAMQSLLSGTISSQINSMLGTVINSNNWNFGANISTGDEGWNNAEYEGLLSGRLLNNRLLIDGQFGYRDNVNNASTSFIGDFDIKYLLVPNGNLAINIYNKTNDRYFTKSSLNTQGLGLIMKKDFRNLRDLFGIKKKKKKKKKENR